MKHERSDLGEFLFNFGKEMNQPNDRYRQAMEDLAADEESKRRQSPEAQTGYDDPWGTYGHYEDTSRSKY